MNEQTFRKLCRQETGGIEMQAFQAALSEQGGAVVSVTFRTGLMETKTIYIARDAAEQYAQWAAEESKPETDLLEYIKPEMRDWILTHRALMCARLKELLGKYNPDFGTDVQIIWPITTPDVVPYLVVKKYLEQYGNN